MDLVSHLESIRIKNIHHLILTSEGDMYESLISSTMQPFMGERI